MRRGAVLHILMALGVIFAPSAWAQAPACHLTPQEARGTPSDALERLLRDAQFTEQRGVGGTGTVARAQERGLGGTGIIGIVTGFGSVCVNGFEINVEPSAVITMEGVSARRADVQLGQLVEIEAYPRNGKLTAASVAIRVLVAGPIDAINADRTEIHIAGQKIAVSLIDISKSRHLIRGDWVGVSGFRRDDGTILGTSLTPIHAHRQQVLVSGRLRASTDGQLRLGDLTVTGNDLAVGQDVVLRGELHDSVLEVRDLRHDLSRPFSPAVQYLSIQAEGSLLESELSRASATSVRLNGELLRQALEQGPPVQADGDVRIGTAFNANAVRRADMNFGGPSPNRDQEPMRSERLPLEGTGQPRPAFGLAPSDHRPVDRPDRPRPPDVASPLRPDHPAPPDVPLPALRH